MTFLYMYVKPSALSYFSNNGLVYKIIEPFRYKFPHPDIVRN